MGKVIAVIGIVILAVLIVGLGVWFAVRSDWWKASVALPLSRILETVKGGIPATAPKPAAQIKVDLNATAAVLRGEVEVRETALVRVKAEATALANTLVAAKSSLTAVAQTTPVVPPSATPKAAPTSMPTTMSMTSPPVATNQSTMTGAQILAASSITVTNPVADSLAALSYASVDQFIQTWGLKVAKDPKNPQPGDIDPLELATCPFESNCVRLLREKNMGAYILPFQVRNQSGCVMDGWMDDPQQRALYGRKEPSTALGSGVPSGWSGLVQGITIRPCNVTTTASVQSTMTSTATSVPAMTASPTPKQTPVPTVVPQSTPTSAAIAWTEQNVRTTFGIDKDVKLAVCPDEKNCWVISGQGFVTIDNPTDCWLTGYRQEQGALMPGQTDKKTGIPPHSVRIKVEVVQFRPCAP